MRIVLCDLHLCKECDPNAAGLDAEIRADIARILMRAAAAFGAVCLPREVRRYPEPTGDDLLAYVTWGGEGGRNCD